MQICSQWFAIRILSVSVASVSICIRKNSRISANIYQRSNIRAPLPKVRNYRFTKGHQYRCTDGLVGTGLMPYKAHSPKYQYFMLFRVSGSSLLEIWDLKQFTELHVTQHSDNEFHLATIQIVTTTIKHIKNIVSSAGIKLITSIN